MSTIKKQTVSIATTTSSTASSTAHSGLIDGRVLALEYVRNTIKASAGHVVSTTAGTQVLAFTSTGNARYYPRAATVTSTGGSIVYSTGGLGSVAVPHVLNQERLKIVTSSGSTGGVKSGSLRIYYEGMP